MNTYSLAPKSSTDSAARSPKAVPIIGGGAGTGLSAKCAEAGGIDLIIIYNSGRYRMAGRGSLAGLMPYGDANAIVVEMAREKSCPSSTRRRCWRGSAEPIHSGSCLDSSSRSAISGFSGVQNFPTVGLIDGQFRVGLEETGMGFGKEVDMIAKSSRDWACSLVPMSTIPRKPA